MTAHIMNTKEKQGKELYGKRSFSVAWTDDPISCCRTCHSRTDQYLACRRCVDRIIALAGATVAWQCIAFIVVSVLLLIFTRPFATRYINRHHEKTNCDELIGRTVRVTEQVDNYEQTGAAFANGLEWTARSEKDDQKIKAGGLATVTAISGVKLILRPVKEEKKSWD